MLSNAVFVQECIQNRAMIVQLWEWNAQRVMPTYDVVIPFSPLNTQYK